MADGFSAGVCSKVAEECLSNDEKKVNYERLQFCRTIRDRLWRSYDSVVKYLHVQELKMLLFQNKLVSHHEAKAITNGEELIKKMEEIGLLAYDTFYTCVTKKTCHLGHQYVLAVLEGRDYASDVEMRHSTDLKEKLRSNLEVLEDCDMKALLIRMYTKNLLTNKEWRKLDKTAEDETSDYLYDFVEVLNSKGPLAHSLFADALHSVNSETHRRIFGEGESPHEQMQELTRRAASPVQRPLPKLKLHGCLRGGRYNKLMKMFQGFHHNGQWAELDSKVKKLMIPGTPTALKVVALLESAVSWVFRRREGKVVDLAAQAKDLIAQVEGDNGIILEGRREYILSRLYRYLRDYDKAKKHIMKATYDLRMVEAGEDTAFLYYCDACIKVETLDAHPTARELDFVDCSYRYAIGHAREHDSGLDLVAPHSFMRLAQMHLGSRHHCAGTQREDESITSASLCLQAVDQSSLSLRSKCHYLLIESDLKRCRQDIKEAMLAAQSALELTQNYNFTTEISSARARIDGL